MIKEKDLEEESLKILILKTKLNLFKIKMLLLLA
jgi:hypothetical protein